MGVGAYNGTQFQTGVEPRGSAQFATEPSLDQQLIGTLGRLYEARDVLNNLDPQPLPSAAEPEPMGLFETARAIDTRATEIVKHLTVIKDRLGRL